MQSIFFKLKERKTREKDVNGQENETFGEDTNYFLFNKQIRQTEIRTISLSSHIEK